MNTATENDKSESKKARSSEKLPLAPTVGGCLHRHYHPRVSTICPDCGMHRDEFLPQPQ